MGWLVDIGDTRLFVEQRGSGPVLIVLHGGPGVDHSQLLGPLTPLADEFTLYFVDQRAQGRSDDAPRDTWTIAHAATDVRSLADALDLRRYAVLGHSYGGLVALQHAVTYPGHAAATVISHGVPSGRWSRIEDELERFEPAHLREQVRAAWDELDSVKDPGRAAQLFAAQSAFHFKNPHHPAIAEMERVALEEMVHTPLVNQHMSRKDVADFDVEERVGAITQPVLVLAGRGDRVCPVEASIFLSAQISSAELVVFEDSGHVSYLEESERYISVVRQFLRRHLF